MCNRNYVILSCIVMLMCANWACKSDSGANDDSLGALGSDTLSLQDNTQRNSSGTGVPAPSSQKSIPSRKTRPQNAPGRNAGATSDDGGSADVLQSGISRLTQSSQRWWDNRVIFFMDWVGGTEDIVHDAIAGQPYFYETRIFVYATDNAMEGTVNYNKTVLTMESTDLDDRIFIWVHLDDARKPIFIKTLISDNIKNKMDQAPLKL